MIILGQIELKIKKRAAIGSRKAIRVFFHLALREGLDMQQLIGPHALELVDILLRNPEGYAMIHQRRSFEEYLWSSPLLVRIMKAFPVEDLRIY